MEELALNRSDNRETLNFKCMDLIGVAKRNKELKKNGIQYPEERIR